jgi:hypothetical protein
MPDTPPGFAPGPQPPTAPAWSPTQLPPPPPPPESPRMHLDLQTVAQALVPFWGRALGFTLVFLGTLVYVAFASVPGSCVSAASGCSSFLANAAWAILVGKVLWTVGLFFIGAGAALKLHWKLAPPVGGTPEQYSWVRAGRRANWLLLLLCIVLLFILLIIPTGISFGTFGPTGGSLGAALLP